MIVSFEIRQKIENISNERKGIYFVCLFFCLHRFLLALYIYEYSNLCKYIILLKIKGDTECNYIITFLFVCYKSITLALDDFMANIFTQYIGIYF